MRWPASSPWAASADELFWAHMVEHLVLGDVGALLLVLGLTGPLLAPVLRLPGLSTGSRPRRTRSSPSRCGR